MKLELESVSVELGDVRIVSDVDLVVEPGELVGLIGPNGSGKSTLLRTIYRALRPCAGTVRLDGRDLWRELAPRAAARRTGAVMQETPGQFDFSVVEVVQMGRTPHKRLLEADDAHDEAVIADALRRVDMLDRAGRLFSTLSGGEKQRVLVARALAQETELLVLDEPTNHLDISHQLELLELIRELGLTTIAALHDLNLAATYCERLYVLADGKLVRHGRIAEVLTPGLIAEVFGVRAELGTHPITGLPHLAFAPLEGSRS